jgi:hypothetical protein
MAAGRWRVYLTPRISAELPELEPGLLGCLAEARGVTGGTPFLISPDFEYYVILNVEFGRH